MVTFDDKDLWDVWIYDEVNMLSNMLMSLAFFKSKCGEYWPKKIMVHRDNRLTLGFGEDIQLNHSKWALKDALYCSMYKPVYDPVTVRTATRKYFGTRKPIEDTNKIYFRSRKDLV